MHDGLKELLEEYCESLKGVRHLKYKAQGRKDPDAKTDASLLAGMESDLEWTIEYIAMGFMPQYSEGHYKKIVPVDPQKVLVWARQSQMSIDLVKQRRDREFINDLLKPLTDKEAEALLLVKAYGVSEYKAAKMMGLSRNTVSSYVDRAINKIFRIRHPRST